MKLCPECRSPILSLMFLVSSDKPEFYCERCCRAVAEVKTPAPEIRRPVLA